MLVTLEEIKFEKIAIIPTIRNDITNPFFTNKSEKIFNTSFIILPPSFLYYLLPLIC